MQGAIMEMPTCLSPTQQCKGMQGDVRGCRGVQGDIRGYKGCKGTQGGIRGARGCRGVQRGARRMYVRPSASPALGRSVGQMVQWYAHRPNEVKTGVQNRLAVKSVHVQSGGPADSLRDRQRHRWTR